VARRDYDRDHDRRAFVPLLFIKGQLGDFLKELPMVLQSRP